MTPFEAACLRRPVPHTPVWIMRQAGRYLPEYRAVREKVDFRTLTRTPDLVAEVTLQPVRRFPLDAAILFSDIMTPLEGMGFEVAFEPGPVVASPVRSVEDADRLRALEPSEDVPFVLEAIRILVRELPAEVPLIGFAGAPFTLFCYLVEGSGSKSFMRARRFLRAEPEVAARLLMRLGAAMGAYLAAQVDAGARAAMLFDSWAELLDPDSFRRFALPAARAALAPVAGRAPVIYFPRGVDLGATGVADLPADAFGVDWRTPLPVALAALGRPAALQGNLDPAALFAPRVELAAAIDLVLEQASGLPGHVFNLGHGIDRATDPDAVAFLVDRVHERTCR